MARPTLEVIAPTVEEAVARGLAQLGLTAADVSVEVLDAGSRGWFGLGKRQVRVRLTVHQPADASLNSTSPAAPTPVLIPQAEPLSEPASASDLQPASAPRRDPILDQTEVMLAHLVRAMGFDAQISARLDENDQPNHRCVHVDVRGRDLSALVGRRAETLNALQSIATLIVGKQSGQFVQLVVDVEGYRARREKQLRQLAKRMADQVMKTGRRIVLEPMSAAERRIIHLALRDHPSVTTESIGEEPRRKVTIRLKK